MRILFVCTGNTCRSPMAEGIFNALAAKEKVRGKLLAASAGVAALDDSPPSAFSVQLCREEGIDIGSHLSRSLTGAVARESDLLLTMTGEQKREVLRSFPETEGKVFTLKEFAGESGDIHDPIGMGEEFYRNVYYQIKKSVKKILEKVEKDEDRDWK